MIVEEIKKSILQSASEGKLTYQKSEENAEEELKGILEDAKDDKKYTYNKLSDIPFNLPDNWIWVKLEDIAFKITDGTHSTPKYTLDGIPFLSVKDLSSGVMNFKNTKFISKEEHNVLFKRCNPEYGDILITKVGTTGIPVIVNTTNEFSLFVSVALIKFNKENIFNKYLYYILSSPVVQSQVVKNTRGVGNKNWVLNAIKSTILPLPPLEEQQRIVDKIEELFSKLDEIKPIEEELKKLKQIFPNDMKKSILNHVLEKFYNNTVSLGNISNINGGYAFKSTEYTNDGIRVIRISDFDENGIKLSNIVRSRYDNYLEQYIIENDNIIMCMTGGTVGKNLLINNLDEKCYTNQRVATIKVNSDYIPKFVYYCINAPYIQNLIQVNKNSTNDNISMNLIKTFPIPKITIEEQQRIVEKLEQLLPLCDDIEKMISK